MNILSLPPIIVGLVVLLVTVIIARIISEVGVRFLSSEEKQSLVEHMSGMRIVSVIVPAIIIILYLIAATILENGKVDIWIFIAFVISILFINIIAVIRLRALRLSKMYRRNILWSKIIAVVGIIAAGVIIAGQLV